MYKKIIRPIFFLFSPESIHHFTVFGIKALRYIPFGTTLLRKLCVVNHPLLEREVFGMKFSNPVGLAAGFDKNCEIYKEMEAFGFGFIEVGTITPKAQLGNPSPRLFRLPKDSAIINRMGFNNDGVSNAVNNLRKRPYTSHQSCVVGGNLGKNTLTPNENAKDDYLNLFRRLYDYVDYFVINISCPNVNNMRKLQNAEALGDILEGIMEFRRGQGLYRPVLMKISPDLTFEQIDELIEEMKKWNLDGIVATNTTTSRDGLLSDSQVVENIGNGGLSGAPLTKRSLEVVRYISSKCEGNYPIIGVGGIMTPDDAVAMLDAGASLIQLYSGFIYNGPFFVKEVCNRIIEREIQKKDSK
ncbi:MAG: quinone-dependent dihydroorotate dehydrogenase, partial [Rikenellaceae bacterium]